MSVLPNGTEIEYPHDGPRDHQVLIGANDPHLDAAAVPRNQRFIPRIALRTKLDAEKVQSVANPLSDERRVFADARGEHERVQAAQSRGEGADPLPRLVTKQVHRLGCPQIGGFPRQQVSNVGIEVSGAGTHHQSSSRGEAHAGVGALAAAYGCQAGSVAEMREDHASLRGCGVESAQFLHQIGVRQVMETVALDALCREASRDRQQSADTRHGAMKRRVEACHLGQFRMALPERLDQLDVTRQVIGAIGRNAAQFREQFRRDPLGFGTRHAVHDAASRGPDRREYRLRFEPVQKKPCGFAVIGGGKSARTLFSSRIGDGQSCAAQADAIDLPIEPPQRRFGCFVHREPDARRAAIDREDAGRRRSIRQLRADHLHCHGTFLAVRCKPAASNSSWNCHTLLHEMLQSRTAAIGASVEYPETKSGSCLRP
jgi:hypothetical protein